MPASTGARVETMVTSSRSSPPPGPTSSSASTQRRAPPPHRYVPDDSFFTASYEVMEDQSATEEALSLKARALLPTPVAAKDCTRMWIPAARLAAEHSIDEILRSLNSDSQSATWKEYRMSLQDFVRIPHQGISFLCTSDAALHSLGGTQLMICGTPVTIRKYSKYDKLYFVDLNRLPGDVPDSDIYDWFTVRGARPVLITPTYMAGGLKSRDRTVYFNQVNCPPELFTEDQEPLREIFFVPDEKPCFVQHRLRKYNRTKPPSLRKPASDGDDSMSGEHATDVQEPRSDEACRAQATPMAVDSSPQSRGTASAVQPSSSSTAPSVVPVTKPRLAATVPALDTQRSLIRDAISGMDPDWKLVQASRRGILQHAGPTTEPAGMVPCDLEDDLTDPSALTYSLTVMPTMYDVLSDEALDASMPPDVDISASDFDLERISGFTTDSPLVKHETARRLMDTRKLSQKVSHVSVAELDKMIQEFVERDVLTYTSHDDVLATIQVQPAYFRRVIRLAKPAQTRLFRTHAVYRAICATQPNDDSGLDFFGRLRQMFGDKASKPEDCFLKIFKTKLDRDTALHYARSDLFFMVFSPGIYFDPVKIQAITPEHLPPKRLRNTPFLLWSDVNLLAWAHADTAAIFINDKRVPSNIRKALNTLLMEAVPSPTAEAVPSCMVRPQL